MAAQAFEADAESMSTWTQAAKLADATPSERNRYVDFLRAASILVVVVGHWLMAAPEIDAGGNLKAGHLLSISSWTHILTWLLQVMPIFFFVGGYSNAVAWRAASRRDEPYALWLRGRLRRLLAPAIPLLLIWVLFAALALGVGLEPGLLRIGSQASLVPMWFLAVYMIVTVTAPITIRAWERLGWGLPASLAGAAAVVDAISIGAGVSWLGWVNFLFVWNAVHSFGYAWADDRIGSMRSRVRLAAAGLISVAALVLAGPYPMAMVGLDGAAVTNSNPPKITLIALGLFQLGLALALERRASLWLEGRRIWTLVIAVNASIMSLYLWHLTVMVALIGLMLLAGGAGLHIAAGSAFWWATRPLWVALLAGLTFALLSLVGRFERPARDPRPAPRTWKPVTAALAASAGLGLLVLGGIADSDGVNGVAVTLPIAGVFVLGVVRVSDLIGPGPVQAGRSRRRRRIPSPVR